MTHPAALLDVRAIAPRERHPEIFRTFDALAEGEALVLVNDHEPRPLLYAFQIERPNAFDWNVLQAGPELFRVEIKKREPSPRTVTELLATDHRRLEAVLAGAARSVAEGDFDTAARRLGEYRCGLARHVAMEEAVLLPAIEERIGTGVPVLVHEHVELVRLADELVAAVSDEDPSFFRGTRGELAELFQEHHHKEEGNVCPKLDAALDDRERDDLVRRMQSIA